MIELTRTQRARIARALTFQAGHAPLFGADGPTAPAIAIAEDRQTLRVGARLLFDVAYLGIWHDTWCEVHVVRCMQRLSSGQLWRLGWTLQVLALTTSTDVDVALDAIEARDRFEESAGSDLDGATTQQTRSAAPKTHVLQLRGTTSDQWWLRVDGAAYGLGAAELAALLHGDDVFVSEDGEW